MLGFDAVTLGLIAAATLVAFVVRGLSGFGSSMIGIGALTTVLPPAQVVPAFLAIELVTSVGLVPSIWREVQWASLRWVVAGCLMGTPIGLALLSKVAPDPMRLLISACLLGIALAMLGGLAARAARRPAPGPLGAGAAGLVSGVLTGAAGIGGPPVVVFYFATASAATGRATLIAYFLFAGVFSLVGAGSAGLLGQASLPLVAVALPFSLLGIWLGQRWYRRLEEARLRILVWRLLAALGALGMAGALWRLSQAGAGLGTMPG